MESNIGKLVNVPLREIWKNEARDFTCWLEENIEILGDRLNLSLSNPEREKSAGPFAVDLVAEDKSGNKVIIECQLEKTDHDHLGKILTYLTSLEAKTAIWICSSPRPEHITAVTWLNEVAPDASFYLVRVEGMRIGESPPAPLFHIICGPSQEAREIGEEKKEYAERHRKRQEFWTQLLEKSRLKTKLHINVSPSRESWCATGAGKSGLAYAYGITQKGAVVELVIDRGKGAEDINKQIFNELYANKEQIESAFEDSLNWDFVEGRRACYITWEYSEAGLKDEDKWDYLQDIMIDAMIRLEKALKNHIARLAI